MIGTIALVLVVILVVLHLWASGVRIFRPPGTTEVELQKSRAAAWHTAVGDFVAWLIVAAALGFSIYLILDKQAVQEDRKFAYGIVGTCLGVAVGRLKK